MFHWFAPSPANSEKMDCDSMSPDIASTEALIMAFSKSSGKRNHSDFSLSMSLLFLELLRDECLVERLRDLPEGGDLLSSSVGCDSR